MDCKTARLLLDFACPQARELEAEEAQALESHLDRCPDCHSQASHERQLDDHLGKAMRQVEVPAGVREQLLARLESARGDWHRQRFAHAARLTAAAAALFLFVWSAWYWVREHWVTPIDTQRVANSISNDAAEDPIARTRRQLKELGANTLRSPPLDYHLLACPPFLTELPGYPGRLVPGLLFVRDGRVARVYLIRERAIPEKTPDAIFGGSFKAQVVDWEGEPYCFLVIYDGENLDWLRTPESTAM